MPVSSVRLPSQEVHGLSLERQAVEIHIPTFWSEQCTLHIHETKKTIVATLRKLGIRVILCLDDMLVMAPMKEEVRKHLPTALELLIALGFMINMRKT